MKRWRGAPFPTGEPFWAELDDESLLDVPMCDLGLMIPGSGLEPWLEKLASELQARGLEFRPHYWLGEEWLCPDGVPRAARSRSTSRTRGSRGWS